LIDTLLKNNDRLTNILNSKVVNNVVAVNKENEEDEENISCDDKDGMVYLIQPQMLKNTNCYKIGCSKSSTYERLRNYHKGTQILMITKCNNPFELEKLIKKEFNNKFEQISGKEYYEWNINEMYNLFAELVMKNIQ